MNSKERVKMTINHQQPDIVPTNFECCDYVMEKLQKHYNFNDCEKVLQKFNIDMRSISPTYIGPELKRYREKGVDVYFDYWGSGKKLHWTGKDYNEVTFHFPFDEFTTVEELNNYQWPSPDWFDYESIKRQCDKFKDKSIQVGHEGPFQVACFLRSMEKLFMDMAIDPEFAHRVYNRMVEFELEFYERILIAGDGQIDIIRLHDDYGTQIGQLFSTAMWKDYFEENTKKLINLTHKYGAFYQQHSCGAIRPIIPELIKCGVDIIEPIQKVKGLEPDGLKKDFGDKVTFHGGIDTQTVLPFGTPEEVAKETKYFVDTLNVNGGYILMASQWFEGDVPIENIEAMYNARY
ncbi:uroporphyrinogen decarboxylase family protein [Clostridium thailandense]|uniref:uroporphyrinogen decarboxylase family protein n=1 Tax=Clostridium thailandense TaxID=2794346 RepID=UPI00398A1B98